MGTPMQLADKIAKASNSYRNAWEIQCAYYSSIQESCNTKYIRHDLTTQGSHNSYDTRFSEHIRTDRTRDEFCENRIGLSLPKAINWTTANLL